MKATVELDGLSNLSTQLEKAKEEYGVQAYQGVVRLAANILLLAKQKIKADGHIVTSRLRNSLSVATHDRDAGAYIDDKGKRYDGALNEPLAKGEVAIGTNVEYAAAIEFGCAPHVIEVKNAKVLTDGKTFFGKRVQHPGFSGSSFLYWAAKHADLSVLTKKQATEKAQDNG